MQVMRTVLFLCFSFITLSSLSSHAQNAQTHLTSKIPQYFSVGQSLKQMSFTTIQGDDFNTSDLSEPVVMVHYWASWCPPCVMEFPLLLKTLREMNGQVAMIAVSLDYKADAMQRYISKLGADDLPIYWVHDAKYDLSARFYRIKGTPETVFLNKERTVIKHINDGYEWGTTESWKELTSMVAGSI